MKRLSEFPLAAEIFSWLVKHEFSIVDSNQSLEDSIVIIAEKNDYHYKFVFNGKIHVTRFVGNTFDKTIVVSSIDEVENFVNYV